MNLTQQIAAICVVGLAAMLAGLSASRAADDVVSATGIDVTTPMPAPDWALLERELMRSTEAACREFYDRYFDDRGYLLCVERWGGDDGPDDAIECVADWPLLYALGCSDEILKLYRRAWEGHLRQYTLAKTTDVEFARDGMYYKEFPVMFDWLHHGEGLTAFIFEGLADPTDPKFQKRLRRFAGLYMGEEPGADNYDAQHKIIRSLFTGSRGPLLRKATALDWAGDPIDVEGRFEPRHGERSYAEMLAHFRDYNDVVGDHPQNLCATSLATTAYMLTHEPKYKTWVVDYVDAWVERMKANHDIIPTNIGLDGKIGGECGGRWYGGVYGWGFTVVQPQNGEKINRNTHHLGISGFGNATLLTGDRRYGDAWRRQIDAVNSHARAVDGRTEYPTMHGDNGWYGYTPQKYSHGATNVYYWSMDRADRERLGNDPWINFLEARAADFPATALRADLETIRQRVAAMRADRTTPDTRLADDPLMVSPAAVTNLVQLMLGGIYPGHVASPLHARLRYFDPQARRAGLPPGTAALVERLSADEVTVVLVNLDVVHAHSIAVQGGAYGEHRFDSVSVEGKEQKLGGRSLQVRLAPGCGARLVLKMARYASAPTLSPPWEAAETK